MTLSRNDLRTGLRSLASGVVVLTLTGDDGQPVGVTLTSLTSVSLEPPLILLTLDKNSRTWAAIERCAWFGIQVLQASQADLAHRFATADGDRFAPPTRWEPGLQRVPFLTDCLSYMLCRPYQILTLGDHHVLVGEVAEVWSRGAKGPALVHVDGALLPVGQTMTEV